MTEQKCPKCGAAFYKMHGDTPLIIYKCGTAVAPDGAYNEDRQCFVNQLAAKDADLAVARRALECAVINLMRHTDCNGHSKTELLEKCRQKAREELGL